MVFDYAEYDLTGLMETVKYRFSEAQVCALVLECVCCGERVCSACGLACVEVPNGSSRACGACMPAHLLPP